MSGDHYIARIAGELRKKGYGGRIYGLCGAESRSAGIESLWASERLQLIGVAEVLGSLPDILRLMRDMCRNVLETCPTAIVVADSPDFHLPLLRRLRRKGYGGRIFYVAPPSVWAWRRYRAADLRTLVDENLPLFRFEHEYLLSVSCKSYWNGHPLVEEFDGWRPDRASFLSDVEWGGEPGNPGRIVALLPGSRRGEIEQLHPILTEVYDAAIRRGYTPIFSIAPGLSDHAREDILRRTGDAGQNRHRGRGRELLAQSLVAAGASGTVAAEALLLRRYMVIAYKLRPLSAFIGKRLLKGVRFGIPNLLAGESFYPELIQDDATGANVAAAVFDWLDADAGTLRAARARMEELIALMGHPGVYDFWSDRILEAIR